MRKRANGAPPRTSSWVFARPCVRACASAHACAFAYLRERLTANQYSLVRCLQLGSNSSGGGGSNQQKLMLQQLRL